MDVILHTNFKCAPDGHTTFSFMAGDTLTGKAAELAMKAGVAFSPVEETKPAAVLENKEKLFSLSAEGGPMGFGEDFARKMLAEINETRPPAPKPTKRRKGKTK